MTAGRLQLDLEEVDLAEVVRHGGRAVARGPAGSGDACSASEAEGPVIGRWDRLRLEQLVTNLLANAMQVRRGAAHRRSA